MKRNKEKKQRIIKKRQNENTKVPTNVGNLKKTKRKQKGFRLKSETLIIHKRQNKTERSADEVRQTLIKRNFEADKIVFILFFICAFAQTEGQFIVEKILGRHS